MDFSWPEYKETSLFTYCKIVVMDDGWVLHWQWTFVAYYWLLKTWCSVECEPKRPRGILFFYAIDMDLLTVNYLETNFLLHQELHIFIFYLYRKVKNCRLTGTGVNLFRCVGPLRRASDFFVLLPRAKLVESHSK